MLHFFQDIIQGHISFIILVKKKKKIVNRIVTSLLRGEHESDLHTGALSAAAAAGAHLRTAVTDVQVIQSPRLLLIERRRLEPAEARGRGPEHLTQKTTKYLSILRNHFILQAWFWLVDGYANACSYFPWNGQLWSSSRSVTLPNHFAI